jgi:hypothetical protein
MFLEKPRAAERWYRGGKWKAKALRKRDLGYSYYHGSLNTERISKLKYSFVSDQEGDQAYDPFVDTPGAYLRFARLGDYQRLHWDEHKLLNEITKFLNDFGPLWMNDPFPITVERILYHACIMTSTIRIYKLLNQVENYEQSIDSLNQLLIEISRTDPNPIVSNNMMEIGAKGHVDYNNPAFIFDQPSDKEVILIAQKYIEERVQIAMVEDPVILTLVLEQTGQIGKTPTRGWIPEYIFTNLLPVLWFQFFLDIVNKSVLKECASATCGRFFVPQRSDQIYCTTFCRNTSNVLKNYYSKKTMRKGVTNEGTYRKEG